MKPNYRDRDQDTFRWCAQCGKWHHKGNFPWGSDLCDFCVCENNRQQAELERSRRREQWRQKRNAEFD